MQLIFYFKRLFRRVSIFKDKHSMQAWANTQICWLKARRRLKALYFSMYSPLDLPGGQRPNMPSRGWRGGGGRDESMEERKEVRSWANPQIWLHQQRRSGQEMNVNLAELKWTIYFDEWGNLKDNRQTLGSRWGKHSWILSGCPSKCQKHGPLLVTWLVISDTGTRCWSSCTPERQLHWSTISV